MSILRSAEQVPQGLPVATGRANHTTCSPWKRQVVSKPPLCQVLSLGTALKAKPASAGPVSSSTCYPSQRQLTSPGPPRLAAGSAVCSSLLSPLELSFQFPKFHKRNRHRIIKNFKSSGDGECFPPTPSTQRQLLLEFNGSLVAPWEP